MIGQIRKLLLIWCFLPLLMGCHKSQISLPAAALFPEAIVDVGAINDAAKFEAEIKARYEVPAPAGISWFRVLDGKSKVLVVAGHATSQIREGKVKIADAGTGALAVLLNRLAGTPAIYTNYQSPSDPNYYDDNDFKKTLSVLVTKYRPKVVLDIHTSHGYRPYDVDFGTMGGKSLLGKPDLLRRLSQKLSMQGITNMSQDYFSAEKNATVTKFVSSRGVPTIQCEINSTWLIIPERQPGPSTDEEYIARSLNAHRFAQLLQGFLLYISSLDSN